MSVLPSCGHKAAQVLCVPAIILPLLHGRPYPQTVSPSGSFLKLLCQTFGQNNEQNQYNIFDVTHLPVRV